MKKLNKQQWKTILILGGVLLVFALLTLKTGMPLVKFCNNPQQFRAWLNDQHLFLSIYDCHYLSSNRCGFYTWRTI